MIQDVGLGSLLMLLAASSLSAQVIRGRVLDADSDAPLEGVNVQAKDALGERLRSAVTDSTGTFRILVPRPGRYDLLASGLGYLAAPPPVVEVAADEVVTVELRMRRDAVPVEGFRVVARRRLPGTLLDEFYERSSRNRRLGIGRIFTREDLDARGPLRVSYLLEQVPGEPCGSVFVDGFALRGEDVDGVVIPADVEGVEIYRRLSEIPVQYYRPGMTCAVLVWTRRYPRDGEPFRWTRVLSAGAAAAVLWLLSAAAF